MKKLMLLGVMAAILLSASYALAAGSCTESIVKDAAGSTVKVALACTGDSGNGSIIAGNEFASVTDVAITNNGTATSGAPTYPKMTLSTGSNVTLSPSGTGSFTLAP